VISEQDLKTWRQCKRCTASAGDLSDSDSEVEAEREEEVAAEDAVNERLIKAIARMGAKAKMDIPVYEGNLDAEELLDWIRALDTYFNYEDVEEDKKVRHAVTRLKGHTNYGGTSYKQIDAAKVSRKLKVGIE
jgi:hypothetical protein